MKKLTLFQELVATEAAVRADYIYRRERFTFHDSAGKPVFYDATNPDRGGTRDEVSSQLYENFIHTYNYMFKDSYQHERLVEAKICNTRDLKPQELMQLHDIFADFVAKNYDAAGNPTLTSDHAAEELRTLYERVTSEIPLEHAGMALGSLFVELGRSKKWKDVTPRGINFTRGQPTDDLGETFREAIHGEDHKTETSKFIRGQEHVVEIGGMRFPRHVIAGQHMDHTHLVTTTGHLVDMTDDLRAGLEQHLAAGKPLEEFKVAIDDKTYHLWQFQQPASEGSEKAKRSRRMVREKLDDMSLASSIDGEAVQSNGSAKRYVPLASMSVDALTGLGMNGPTGDSELKTFKEFLAREGYKDFASLLPEHFQANITAMQNEDEKQAARATLRAHVAGVMNSLKEKAAGDEHLLSLVERAGKKLEITLPRIYELTDKAFIREDTGEVKYAPQGNSKPNMYLTMGGTASGKGGLKRLAQKECGGDLVVASLDDARMDCDRYWLYLATNNHSDDYKTVEEFAKVHRDLTTRRAQAGHYNLFIDGSGIPYEGRNDAVTEQFKQNGYTVSVLAAQAPLYVNDPKWRKELSEHDSAPHDSARRLGDRLQEELRTVPIEIAAEKHIGFPIASRNAARDSNVDRFMIEDVSGPVGSAYTLSYVQTVDEQTMKEISALQGVALKKAIEERKLVPDWVKLPEGHDRDEYYDAKVIRDNENGTYRMEIITDLRQYVNMVQKGLLRRNAIGPEAWFDNTVRSDIEGHFKGEKGQLRLQSPIGVTDITWTNYDPLSARRVPNGQNGVGDEPAAYTGRA